LKDKASISKETVSAALSNTRFKVTSFEENEAVEPEKKKL
jgi:hypothetical protein